MPGRRTAAPTGLILLGLCFALTGSSGRAEPPHVLFLDGAKAAEAYASDEARGYFDRLQTLEMSAKTGRGITGEGLAEQRAECRKRYMEAALDFTSEEIAALLWAVKRLDPHLRRNYPRVVESGWSFLKLDSHIEGGLPHTIGSHIVLSPRFLAAHAGEHGTRTQEKLRSLGGFLLHERLHVVQRRHPGLFDALYTKVWGFHKLDSLDLHPRLIEHQVVNPDAQHAIWIYRVKTAEDPEWIWPTLYLGESRGVRRLLGVPSLTRDVRMVAVGLDRVEGGFTLRVDAGGVPVVRRLLSFHEYRSQFPFSMAPYHPDEIAAEGFAQVVIEELLRDSREGGPPADSREGDPWMIALRRWFATHLD
jgi:hypothetical protein